MGIIIIEKPPQAYCKEKVEELIYELIMLREAWEICLQKYPQSFKIKQRSNKVKEGLEMKKSLADRIEQYIKVLIARSEEKMIEIQRAELAETFSCVPSQVTYVLSTRFTEREGYFTESRRGGCGYVRIMQFSSPGQEHLPPSGQLFTFIDELTERQLLSGREAEMIKDIAMSSCQDLPPDYRSKVSEGMMKALKQFIED